MLVVTLTIPAKTVFLLTLQGDEKPRDSIFLWINDDIIGKTFMKDDRYIYFERYNKQQCLI